ncbi:b0688c02-37b9-4c44-a4cb-2c8455ed9cba [Thermothielavioides terrestris]|uniref:B0688c02-37b9-4c44-a4cb-2c8455ed9cba n=1 Tax=Thermothielavioides terrestris TaxID=2587410 RepID=A0A446BUK1_9PEZI|nr:b0688c02-37b9-4c44-a4cb-2c8455ed9cba [Thermothielavioides terrestris]
MTVSSEAEGKVDAVPAMSDSSSPSTAGAPAPAGDEAASTIMVNTKTPAAASAAAAAPFPPPKTDKPRPHVCGTCQRSFARLEHLKRHERSHTKEKPFECPECARCFARRDLLLRHQQKLHQTTTPSSRPRNRRESASGATPGGSRVRKNSIVGSNAPAAGTNAASMRPRANTISHVDGAAMQMIAAANAQVSRMPPTHSRHPSLVGLPTHGLEAFGMAAALAHRGAPLGLPKLETHGIHGMDFSSGLRTAPPLPFGTDFELDGLFFNTSPGSTINPNALHYNDSPPSMAMDPLSPFPHGLPDMSAGQSLDETLDWLPGFEHQMSFNNGPAETAVDGSSPSALSTTSQSGISDVMVDGSNHHTASVVTSSMWQSSIMGPPQMSNPFSLDMSGSVFPDLLNGAPLSPQPSSAKTMGDSYFSTPPPSLSSLSPTVVSGLNSQNLNQTLNFGAGPETPSSMNGSNHGTLPVSTITDSTRNAILGALSASQASQFGSRRYSFTTPMSPTTAQSPPPAAHTSASTSITNAASGNGGGMSSSSSSSSSGIADLTTALPSTPALRRYVGAYLRYFHPHLPFVHVPTLSFETPAHLLTNGQNSGVGGSGCLLLSMAAIGALFESEHQASMELFGMAKKMIQLYLDERRKANVRKAESIRRTPLSDQNSQQQESSVETPVWLVQAMLLNVVYGHNCGDKRSGEIASTHAAALVSLAHGAELLRPVRVEPAAPRDVEMLDADGAGAWNGYGREHADDQAEWLRWKTMEERKRTLYAVFILSSLLVLAYNHTPALTNSEILLDLPCDEEFFAAETAAAFREKGGVSAANYNRVTFHEALGELLRTNEKQQKRPFADVHTPFGLAGLDVHDPPKSELKTSSFGCLILIHALHNYIWETRQRHHSNVWTNEETEKMHRHIEPALQAWHSVWASDPRHSPERPNPYGAGPLSADCVPLHDLAYVRLFVNLSRSKEKFWLRDWDGMAQELANGSEIVQHTEPSPSSNADSAITDSSIATGTTSITLDSPSTQSSPSPELTLSGTINPALTQQPMLSHAETAGNRSVSRKEKHLRKAASFAAESLCGSDKLGVAFANLTSRELPLQATLCVFDCAQVLAEWVATVQDRVGRYLGIIGRDNVDFSQVPAIMLLEEEDLKLLGKIDEIIRGAQAKMDMDAVQAGSVGGGGNGAVSGMDSRLQMDDSAGYASKLLRVTAYMFDKAAVWPVTRLITSCLETHANRMRARAERSILALN